MIRIWLVVLAFVLSLFRLMALGLYSVVAPEQTTNLITNPSAETADTGYTGDSSTVARSTVRAKFGVASINVTPTSAATAGMYYAVSLSTTTTYTFTFWIFSNAGVTYRTYAHDVTAGTTLSSNIVSITGSAAWQAVTLTFTTGANSSVRLFIGKASGSSTANYYVDALQLEAKAYATTYCDGDQRDCQWGGTRHASLSTRTAATRAGGRVWDLQDLMVFLLGHSGGGMAPVANITSEYGLLPGSTYQRTKVMGRLITLTLDQDDSQAVNAFQALHDVRRQLIELFDPFGVEGSQPTIVRYTGGSEPLEIDVFYDAGLEGGDTVGFVETATLRLLAPQPFWRQIGNSTKTLSVNETIANANYIVQRSSAGIWGALSTGMNGDVYTIMYGPDGYLYAGGLFTTAGGGAASNIARWDGSAWAGLNGGVNGAVYDLAFNAAGTLFAVGNFTTSNGGTATVTNYIAQWNGSAWSAVGAGTNVAATVNAVDIGTNGDVYIGGAFSSVAGNANAKGIAKWNGSSWEALSTGTSGADFQVRDLAVAPSGNVYLVGGFDLAGGVANTVQVARWTPANSTYAPLGTSRFDPLGTGITPNPGPYAVAIGLDNMIYVGGDFTATLTHPHYIAQWNGSAWVNVGLGGSLDGVVRGLTVAPTSGALFAVGEFVSSAGVPIPDRVARFSGSTWDPLWIDLPGSPFTHDIAIHRYGRIAIGYSTSGTATSSNIADTTVTNSGSAPASPVISITGPGVLESFVNMTTGAEIFFNGQQLQAGEVATLDLRPGQLSFSTTFGRNLLPTILSSHPSGFRFVRGDNTILVKMSGTTAASAISCTWQELHWSYDV